MKQEDLAPSQGREREEVASPLMDLTNQFREAVEDLHDWENDPERAVLIIAVDEQASLATAIHMGNETALEEALFALLTMERSRGMRHRLTEALSAIMVQELEYEDLAQSLALEQKAN